MFFNNNIENISNEYQGTKFNFHQRFISYQIDEEDKLKKLNHGYRIVCLLYCCGQANVSGVAFLKLIDT